MNKVLFFAHLRDAVGAEEVSIEAAGKTVTELKAVVAETYKIAKMDTVMTAINEEFAPDEEIIQAEDVIAFIPPVSGGWWNDNQRQVDPEIFKVLQENLPGDRHN